MTVINLFALTSESERKRRSSKYKIVSNDLTCHAAYWKDKSDRDMQLRDCTIIDNREIFHLSVSIFPFSVQGSAAHTKLIKFAYVSDGDATLLD